MSWRLLLHQAVPTWIPCRTHTRSHRKPEARALLPQKQHSCVRMDALTSEEVEHNSLQGPPTRGLFPTRYIRAAPAWASDEDEFHDSKPV